MRNMLFAVLCGLFIVFPAAAIDKNVEAFADPIQEKRYQALLEELRCVVCQNQSLADSNAELAQDLRNEVRAMLVQGKSDREIMDFLVQRYGDFVLYKPPLQTRTYLLWFGPLILLLIAAVVIFNLLRRQKTAALDEELDEDAQARLRRALHKKEL